MNAMEWNHITVYIIEVYYIRIVCVYIGLCLENKVCITFTRSDENTYYTMLHE